MDLSDEQKKIIAKQEARNAKRKQRKPRVKENPLDYYLRLAKNCVDAHGLDTHPITITIFEVEAQFGVGFLNVGNAWLDRNYALSRYKIIYDTYQEYQNVKNVQLIISRTLEFGHDFTYEELTETTPEFSNVEMP